MKRQERHSSFWSLAARALLPRRWLACLLLALAVFGAAARVRADDLTRQVQEELRKRNLYFGDVDGRRTPEVAAALRRYQSRKGFPASGDMDDQTLRSLSLEVPLPMSFAPPAAAIAVSNPNPAPANAGGGGGASADLSQETTTTTTTTVPYWPDITVLRSDQGRHAPPPSAAASLSGLVPNSGDPISPPARFTPVPPSSSTAAELPTAADVRDFIARYLRAGQTNAPEGELAFYGDKVKYFNEGTVDRQFIAKDIRRYENRWPERSFTVVGPVSVVADANNFDHTLVHFRYRFTEKNKRFTVNGEADTLYTLVGTGPDTLRIISLREDRVRNPAR